MKFNCSYIKLVYDAIDGKENIDSLQSSIMYCKVREHANVTERAYNHITDAIISIQNGSPDELGTLLLMNRSKVFDMISLLKSNELNFIDTIITNVNNIYPSGNYDDITVYFILGYDAFSSNGDVVFTIFNYMLSDHKELISLLIHEVTHVIHSQYCKHLDNLSFKKDALKSTLDLLFQTEGISIFSAYNYRVANDLINRSDNVFQQDYEFNSLKFNNLKSRYFKTMQLIDEDENLDVIMDFYFSARTSHSLGFMIFLNEYNCNGINAVSTMAQMNIEDFSNTYLNSQSTVL